MADSEFQVNEAIGTCQVGTVWSAVDAAGRYVTVATLDTAVASDLRWRSAFAAKVNELAQQVGGPRVVGSDTSAASPWVACAAEGGPGAEQIFLALGVEYRRLLPAGAGGAPNDDRTVAAAESQTSPHVYVPEERPTTPAHHASAGPWAPVPSPATSHPSAPAAAQPIPVSPAPVPMPPAYEDNWWPAAETQPLATGGPALPPAVGEDGDEPRRRGLARTFVVLAVTLVSFAVGAAVGTFAITPSKTAGSPTSGASSALPVAAPASSPREPGLEPPRAAAWPEQWPRFGENDAVQTLVGLDGLGFALKVPQGWQCQAAGRAQGYANYHCGPNEQTATSVEIIVRDCAKPCDDQQRAKMRMSEEAWGRQWVSTSRYCTYVEASPDGGARHGLVLVAYWRSGSDGAVDRQLVLRMTSPVDKANQLRQVANYLRSSLIF